jgi:hypothetical protein
MPHVRDELLAVLRCPVTKASLVQEGDELVSTVAGPGGSTLRYRIVDGILLLLRAEQLADAAVAGSGRHDGGPAADVSTQTDAN